jgi:lipopolysaccharide O-acetyltransferase
VIEAAASGMPVMSSTHCDIPFVLSEENGQYLVPERDAPALARSIERLFATPDWKPIVSANRAVLTSCSELTRSFCRRGIHGMRRISQFFLFCYRVGSRLTAKTFSLLIGRSFASFGAHSVLTPPLRLSGEDRIRIGSGVFFGPGCWLQALPDGESRATAISVGDGTSVAGSCVISAQRNVHLEDSVLLARNVYISDHIHRYTQIGVPIVAQGIDKVQPVVIKKGAWLGQNVVVCPGVTIGIGAVVGANSVVTQDIDDYSLAVGAPARVVKTFEGSVIR